MLREFHQVRKEQYEASERHLDNLALEFDDDEDI